MQFIKEKMLRVSIRENDRLGEQPLYEAIVTLAARLGIAGATVHPGILGYGTHHQIQRHTPMALWRDDPVVIVIVDSEEKIMQLITALEPMLIGGCMITISDVTVAKYDDADANRGSAPEPQR